jgi:iron complex outermembrane receptor protein
MARIKGLLSAGVISGWSLFVTTSAYAQAVSPPNQDAPAPNQALTAGPSNAADIVVTATKRAQRLQDVPISISAFDQASMDRRGVRDVTDLAAITPGLSFQTTGTTNNITIRGVAGQALRGPSTTAIYIDDIPLQTTKGFGTTITAVPKVFDLDRVEVLRGPQGTLFGGSAMGGAIRFVTPRPSLSETSGYIRSEIADTVGGGLSYETGVAIGGPIVQDRLGFRVSGWYRRDSGYVDNFSTFPAGAQKKDANSSDSYVIRGALTFSPSENVTIIPSIYFQKLNLADRGFIDPQASDVDNGDFVKRNLLLSPAKDKFYLPSLNVSVDLGGVSLTSITSYLDRTNQATADYTAFIPFTLGATTPLTQADAQQAILGSKQKNFTQEFRLASSEPGARFRWTIGAFYSHSSVDGVQEISAPNFDNYIQRAFGVTTTQKFPRPLVNGYYSAVQAQGFRDQDISGFVNAEYDIFDRLTLAAGVRVSHLKQKFYYRGDGPLAGLSELNGVASSSPVTPRFSINFKPTRNQLFYISAAKGYRAGGANTPPALRSQPTCVAALSGYDNTETYQPDSLWSYEAGSKTSLFGGKVRIDASAFQIKWKGIQNNISVPQCGSNFIANLGDATINGFDLGLSVQPIDNLIADLNVGYTSATYSKGAGLGTLIYTREGEQIADTPPWSITAALEYRFAFLGGSNGYVRAENRYRSRNKGNFAQLNPANRIFDPTFLVNPSVNELNLRLGAKWEGIDVSVFGNNILNEHVVLDGIGGSNPYHPNYGGHPIRPATYGLTAIYRW